MDRNSTDVAKEGAVPMASAAASALNVSLPRDWMKQRQCWSVLDGAAPPFRKKAQSSAPSPQNAAGKFLVLSTLVMKTITRGAGASTTERISTPSWRSFSERLINWA